MNRGNKIVTTTTSQSCKSSGGGGSFAVIAGGARSPSPQYHNQNNNKSAFTRPREQQQDHLLNSLSCDSNFAAQFSAKFASASFEDMAGDIRLVDGKKPRKQWTLRDRSNMSVHLLKANLAEDGCDAAQLDVAKKLLQDSTDPTFLESTQKENSRLAIYWLIKSSEQGHEEATRLLKECLSTGHGITGQNILDVKTCISTPTNEKLTFKAARLLYLNLNNGEEFITTTQLEARIHEVKKKLQFQEKSSASTENSPDHSFNEADENTISFSGSVDDDPIDKIGLNTTFTYSRSNTFDAKQNEESSTRLVDGICSKENLTSEQLSTQGGVKLTIQDLLNAAGSFNTGNLTRPAISSKKKELGRHSWEISCRLNAFVAQLLILAALSGTIKFTYCCIYSAAWLSLWASYNVLIWKKRYSNFQDWSDAFKSVLVEGKGTWSDEKPENRLIIKFLLPYLACLTGSLVLFTILDELQPLKAIVGVLVIFSVFKGPMGNRIPNWKIVLIFAIASLPSVLWKVLTNLDSQLELNTSQQAIEWKDDLINQLEAYCSVPNKGTVILTFQILLAISLIWGRRNNLLRESLPELLFAFWFLKIAQISTSLNIEEIYICGAASIILVIAFIVLKSNLESWKATITIIGTILVVISALLSSVKLGSVQKFIGLPPNSSKTFSYENIENFNHLEWDEYNRNCHRRAWKAMSPAETQLRCFVKYGGTPIAVRWIGRLSVVKIRDIQRDQVDNEIEDVTFDLAINILMSEGSETTSWQSYLPGSDNQHSVPANILVSTTSLSDSNEKQDFINYILDLRTGDRFEFHGILNKDLVGSLKPEIVNVQSLKCLSCAVAENYVEYFLGAKMIESEKSSDVSNEQNDENDYLSLLKPYWELAKSYL